MISVVPIEPNPLYPLPADYASLTTEGQRLARVNALRQWVQHSSSITPAEALVHSTKFLDDYYLRPDEAADFDPLFYDMTPLPTPSIHWDLSRMWASHRLSIALAPRGIAKSTHKRRDILLRLVSHPAYSVVYATSTHDNAEFTGQAIRDQLYENSRISDDFAPEYGPLKPTRGAKPTGIKFFYASNGSYLRCLSAESRIRSIRPRRFCLDDPEYDERASTSMATIRDYMDKLLFKLIVPTTLRDACAVDWTGTFVSKRHFLFHAMQVIETPEGIRAADPRFEFWARRLFDVLYEDPQTGETRSIWPEMWPATEAEKVRLNRPGSVSLEAMAQIMGISAFNAEMRGRPGTTEEQFFKLDPSPTGRHAWWYEQPDDFISTNPLASSALFCWRDPTGTLQRVPLPDFLRSCRLFCTVDSAYTEKAHSDRRCCMVFALNPSNELFVLDLWSDRKADQVLVSKTFALCALWRCSIIGVEVVRESFKLYQRFVSAVQTKMTSELGLPFVPSIKDLRPGTMEKTAKIETLDLRFEHGLIKFPLFKRLAAPWWSRLFDQVESFNPEAPKDGGLQHDDEIDCCSMSFLMIRSRLKARPDDPTTTPLDPIAEIKAGRTTIPGTSVPFALGLPLSSLSPEDTSVLLQSSTAAPSTPSRA